MALKITIVLGIKKLDEHKSHTNLVPDSLVGRAQLSSHCMPGMNFWNYSIREKCSKCEYSTTRWQCTTPLHLKASHTSTTEDLSILYAHQLPFIFQDDNTLEVYGHQENLLLSYILM